MRRQDDEGTEKLGANIQINEGREKGIKNGASEG